MDAHGLLAFLEGLRADVPGFLQGAFDDLVHLVRDIVDAVDQTVAPPEVIDAGKRGLSAHHSTLLGHTATLKASLDDFQTIYTGKGSDAYFQTAYDAHLHLGRLTDHLSFAMGAHDTISTNLGDGQVAQGALFVCVGAMVVTLPAMPEGTPIMAGEGAGAGISIAALWAAMDAIGTALAGLTTAALPYLVVGTAALVMVTALTGDASPTIVFATKLNTADGPVRARKLSNGEVKKLRDDDGIPFEKIKQKLGYPANADIYVDENGDYWIVMPGSDWAEPFP